jgi:mercuric ion binding protein
MMTKQLLAVLILTALSTGASAGTIEMKVNGLVCGFCAQGIDKTLRKNANATDVLVSLEDRLVAIATKDGTDISDAELRKALTNAGYEVKAIERTQNSLASLRERIKSQAK